MDRLNQPVDDVLVRWDTISHYLKAFSGHRRLLAILVVVFEISALVVLFGFTKASYQATAIIGPPQQEAPVSSDVNGSSSLIHSMLGGATGGVGSGRFQEYLQILRSERLAQTLVEKDHILQEIFYGRWNSAKRQWRVESPAAQFKNRLKAILYNRRIPDVPDVNSLHQFLISHLKASPIADGNASSFLGATSPFYQITLNYNDPDKAKRLLALILHEADNIIREDMARNVSARLVFLKSELSKVTFKDQREAMIALLSRQEQMSMMLRADGLVASNMVDPPYSSGIPIAPIPSRYLVAGLSLAFMFWCGFVLLGMGMPQVEAVIRAIELRFDTADAELIRSERSTAVDKQIGSRRQP